MGEDWRWWQVALALLAYWTIAASAWIIRMRGAARHGRLPIVAQRETAEGVEIEIAGQVNLLRVAAVALAPLAAITVVLMWTGRS